MNDHPMPALAGPFDDDDLAVYFERLDHDVTDSDREFTAEIPAARWQIVDDEAAEWAARKLAAAALVIREKQQLRDWWVSQINDWYLTETSRAQRTFSFFEGRLQDYALRERLERERATIKLPSAEFGTTARSPKVDVSDDEILAGFLTAAYSGAEGVAWKEAIDKLGDERLYAQTSKVYVGPLRKVVSIERRENGYEVVIKLGCEHEQTWFAETLEGEAPSIGEIIGCDACQDARPVADVEFIPIVEHVAVGPDGAVVPGVVVDPGGIEPKRVTPRG